jgi:hypothetical protein
MKRNLKSFCVPQSQTAVIPAQSLSFSRQLKYSPSAGSEAGGHFGRSRTCFILEPGYETVMMCRKRWLLLCCQKFFYGGDKTEKLSNRHYADIQTCAGFTDRYFITFTRRHQRDELDTQILWQYPAISGHVLLPEGCVSRSPTRFACRLNYVPRGIDLLHSLYLFLYSNPLLRLYPLLSSPFTDPFHTQRGISLLKGFECKCNNKRTRCWNKSRNKNSVWFVFTLDRKSKRIS